MVFATGDTHGNFMRFSVENFPEQLKMTREDYVIITGDFGGIWCGDEKEQTALDELEALPFTLLWVDGNHENYNLLSKYPEEDWHGGRVQRIRPHILHLMRGQIFDAVRALPPESEHRPKVRSAVGADRAGTIIQ